MRRIVLGCLFAAAVCGCVSSSPYDHLECWLIREDAVRAFIVPADIIYVQSVLYTKSVNVADIHAYANSEVGRGRFCGVARVFAPLVATREDMENALDWYFRHHHTDERPFIFIGEGEGGSLLHNFEIANNKKLLKKGLVASFYTETSHEHFLTEKIEHEIRDAIAKAHYRSIWNREIPEDPE